MTRVSSQPQPSVARHRGIRLAVVGLGERAAWMLKAMSQVEPDVRLAVVVDPGNPTTVQEKIDTNELPCVDHVARYSDLEAMLDRGDEIDGVVIGTRCNLHTPLAIRLAETGLPLFLEKPVAISWAQINQLRHAYSDARGDNVVVSFPLARTPIFDAVHAMVRSGRLGEVNQIQAINNVNYGNVYVDNWYRDCTLTGGLWLQKATHDFDYIHRLANAVPMYVTAMHSRQVWGENTLNQDSGSAIVQYHSGLHANYSQNFLTRRSAGRRGAIITGEDATVWFDWYENAIRVTDHREERVENTTIKDEGGHGGGDHKLARNFMDLVLGRAASLTPMKDALLSAATCLAARDSAHKRTVEPIPPQSPDQHATMDTRPIEPEAVDA